MADDDTYKAIALECMRGVIATTDFNQVAQHGAIGWNTLIADVFDLADAMAAELEVRLARRQAANKDLTAPPG